MELRGIATAVYGTQQRSTVSVTTLTSESPDKIFIEKTQKAEIDPFSSKEAREAFLMVLDEVCRQPPQVSDIGGQAFQIPTALIYGTPENHPSVVYSSMLRGAFPEYFGRNARSSPVHEILNTLFLAYHAQFGMPGSAIETKPHYLFPPEEDAGTDSEVAQIMKKGFNELHARAELGIKDARVELEECARAAARNYVHDIQKRGISPPRFIRYVPQHYAFLEWYDLRDIFIDELFKFSGQYNLCLKTPNDPQSPPFADICAAQLADYWNIIGRNQKKGHVYARHSRE